MANKIKSSVELKKFFQEKYSEDRAVIPIEERKCFMDPANVMGVIPKTKLFKEMLVANFDVSESKVPTVDYSGSDIPRCKYSLEYIKKILKFLTIACPDETSVIFTLKKNYPLMIEMQEFDILLAPRVDN